MNKKTIYGRFIFFVDFDGLVCFACDEATAGLVENGRKYASL